MNAKQNETTSDDHKPALWARPSSWTIVLLILVLGLSGWIVWEKLQADQLAKLEAEKALQELKAQNDAREAYLGELRKLLVLDPCEVEVGLSKISPPQGIALPVLFQN